MSLTIVSNGSKWAGQEPDSVEKLLEVLATTPLDPTFEDYGNFVLRPCKNKPCWSVWGNFFGLSHVFNIEGTAIELRPLVRAIRANQKSEAYLSAKE